MIWHSCCLWNIFSDDFESIKSCYNKSINIMADLPYSIYGFLIENITEMDYIRKIVIKRFLKFNYTKLF